MGLNQLDVKKDHLLLIMENGEKLALKNASLIFVRKYSFKIRNRLEKQP